MVHAHFQSTSFFVPGPVCKISHTRCRLYQSEKQVCDPHVSWTTPLPRFGSQRLILHLTSSPTARPLPPTPAGFPCSGADHVVRRKSTVRRTHAGQASQQNRQANSGRDSLLDQKPYLQSEPQTGIPAVDFFHSLSAPRPHLLLIITCHHHHANSGRNALLHPRSRKPPEGHPLTWIETPYWIRRHGNYKKFWLQIPKDQRGKRNQVTKHAFHKDKHRKHPLDL